LANNSIGKCVFVYQLPFTIYVDNGQLLAIFVHSERNRGELGDSIVNRENMICPRVLSLRICLPEEKPMPMHGISCLKRIGEGKQSARKGTGYPHGL
jgi:hypothetical protein